MFEATGGGGGAGMSEATGGGGGAVGGIFSGSGGRSCKDTGAGPSEGAIPSSSCLPLNIVLSLHLTAAFFFFSLLPVPGLGTGGEGETSSFFGGSGGSGRSSFGGKGGSSLSEMDGSWGSGLPLILVMAAPVSGSFGGRGGIALPLSSLELLPLCGSCGGAVSLLPPSVSSLGGSGGRDRNGEIASSSSFGGRGGSARVAVALLLGCCLSVSELCLVGGGSCFLLPSGEELSGGLCSESGGFFSASLPGGTGRGLLCILFCLLGEDTPGGMVLAR